MDKYENLKRLKKLYSRKEVKEGFESQDDCIEWANSVAPLLKFNNQYYTKFVQNLEKLHLDLSSSSLITAFKLMISQMDMAINDLEYREKKKMNVEKAWEEIAKEFGISKREFGRRIPFINDSYKRTVIFRDVAQAYILSKEIFSKPAVILAGSVIEELLREYLKSKNIQPQKDTFNEYIKSCEEHGLLKKSIFRLSDSIREFRNLVHISKEIDKKHSISKATAIGAVSSIFTIANDF